MADAPKEPAKGLTMFEQVMMMLIFLFFFSLISWRFSSYYAYYYGSTLSAFWQGFLGFLRGFAAFFKVVAILVTIFGIWGIIHAYGKLTAINKAEKEIYGAKLPVEDAPAPVYKNERWERVIAHVNSANSSDWRLAVLEADIMLDELLKSLGYHGESLGERLRAVEKSDMLTLDNAWEAHRIRNQIAHQGAEYPLSEREAKRAVALYESVFKEYKII